MMKLKMVFRQNFSFEQHEKIVHPILTLLPKCNAKCIALIGFLMSSRVSANSN